jgi:hypothetical protein
VSGGYGHRIALALALSGTLLFVKGHGTAFAADDLNVCTAPDSVPAEARLEGELSGQDIDARLLMLSAGSVLCLDWAGQTARLTPAGIGRTKAQVAVHCMASGKVPSAQEGVLYSRMWLPVSARRSSR